MGIPANAMSEIQRKNRAYLFFFIVGLCVLALTLLEMAGDRESFAMFLVIDLPISVPVTVTMIYCSVAATVYSLVMKPKDWPLVFLAIVTISYELFAIVNIMNYLYIFDLGLFVVSNTAVETISIAYAIVGISFCLLWVLKRRSQFDS